MTARYGSLKAVRTPDRPGPGPTPDALLGALDVDVRRRVEGLLAGDYRSNLSGEGTELSRIRPYQPGDDVRRMDWNVTARVGEPHVRVNVAERALTAWIALDVSPSMGFGTADRRKTDVAEGVALALGHVATRGGNRLGLLAFGGRDALTQPPAGGKAGMLALLRTLRLEPDSRETGPTSLGEALGRLSLLARRRGLVAVVSDFRGPRDWRRPLLELANHHDTLAVEVRDPREQELPDVGYLRLVDPETGRQLEVDTRDRRLRERFAAGAAAEREEVAAELRREGVDHIVLSTRGDWLRTLAGSLNRRGVPRRRWR